MSVQNRRLEVKASIVIVQNRRSEVKTMVVMDQYILQDCESRYGWSWVSTEQKIKSQYIGSHGSVQNT